MKNFNLERLNLKKISLGENPITLKRTDYKEVINNGDNLLDDNGNHIGTKGDMYTKIIMDNILQNGCLDHNPRPTYEDMYENGIYLPNKKIIITEDNKEIYISEKDKVIETEKGVKVLVPAHTISVNRNVETTYDLSKGESPLTTLRPIATKSSNAEILWIYQKQSNDLVVYDELLGKNVWEEKHIINNWWEDWALKDENGNYILNDEGHPTIGACYGETVRRHDLLKKEVIEALKKNPDNRRSMISLWQQDDFKDPHGLKPCAFLTNWNIRHDWDGKDYLDMTLTQRSSDFATAGCINQVQYVALQKMVARELGIEPGTFTWKPVNVQLYDRHIDQAIEILNRDPITCKAEITVNEDVKKFDDFKLTDIEIVDYPKELIKKKNPDLKFPLGI
ncbi:MAG: thymidylate synthase [Firmicutes bacterium]|nr:thymidylate synthase [Bacillota bacterium]